MQTAIKIVCIEDDYVLKGILRFIGGEEKLGFENNHVYSIWDIWEKDRQVFYFEDIMNNIKATANN